MSLNICFSFKSTSLALFTYDGKSAFPLFQALVILMNTSENVLSSIPFDQNNELWVFWISTVTSFAGILLNVFSLTARYHSEDLSRLTQHIYYIHHIADIMMLSSIQLFIFFKFSTLDVLLPVMIFISSSARLLLFFSKSCVILFTFTYHHITQTVSRILRLHHLFILHCYGVYQPHVSPTF